jgi:hypothetical protein
LPALVFVAQSPYSGWKNVANSRNVMRNLAKSDVYSKRTHDLISPSCLICPNPASKIFFNPDFLWVSYRVFSFFQSDKTN